MDMEKIKTIALLLTAVGMLMNSGCTTLPPAPPQPVVNSLPAASTGTLVGG